MLWNGVIEPGLGDRLSNIWFSGDIIVVSFPPKSKYVNLLDRRLRLCDRSKMAISAMRRSPPRIPPTIAPVGEFLSEEVFRMPVGDTVAVEETDVLGLGIVESEEKDGVYVM